MNYFELLVLPLAASTLLLERFRHNLQERRLLVLGLRPPPVSLPSGVTEIPNKEGDDHCDEDEDDDRHEQNQSRADAADLDTVAAVGRHQVEVGVQPAEIALVVLRRAGAAVGMVTGAAVVRAVT